MRSLSVSVSDPRESLSEESEAKLATSGMKAGVRRQVQDRKEFREK